MWTDHSGRATLGELHHPKVNGGTAFHRVQAVNQIGLGVVDSLWEADDARGASGHGLREKLIVDNWGSLILGQQHHFLDAIHPKALPASYLYGNMLLEQLQRATKKRA